MENQRSPCSLIFQPFIIGNIRKTQRGHVITDGNVSSAVSFACLLSVVFVIIAVFGPLSLESVPSKVLVWVFILVLFFSSLVCTVLLTFMIYKSRDRWITTREGRLDPSVRLKTKFLWIFGCGMILQTSMTLAINIECIQKGGLVVYYAFSILSSLIMMLHLVWQLGFITYLQNSIFVSRKTINYSVMVMIISNVSLWFKILTDEIRSIQYQQSPNGTVYYNNSQNSLDSQCYLKSEIYLFSNKLKPYLTPVKVEYLLLASMFIFRMWPTFQISSLQDNITSEDSGVMSTVQEKSVVIAGAICGIITNVPFFIQTLLLATVYVKDVESDAFAVYHGMIAAHNAINLILVILCNNLIRKVARISRLTAWSPGSSEYILLLANAGLVADKTIAIVASAECLCVLSQVALSAEILSLIQSYFQTIFILESSRFEQVSRHTSRFLRFILIYLFISNLSFWFTATFIGLQGQVVSEGQNKIFPHGQTWNILQHILYPLFMFYRFQSAMYFYSLFHRFR